MNRRIDFPVIHLYDRAASLSNTNTDRIQSSGSNPTSTTRARNIKRRKQRILMFIRVLLKYLEIRDPRMHADAKNVINDCIECHRIRQVGYECVTFAMKHRLKELVGDDYWTKAIDLFIHFFKQSRNLRKASTTVGSRSRSTHQNRHQAQQATAAQQQQQ